MGLLSSMNRRIGEQCSEGVAAPRNSRKEGGATGRKAGPQEEISLVFEVQKAL